ncbi:MAG: Succinyl-CoA ligase [ADP-forming] beta chain, partial [uncultured Solirubrobacteraceae bacterium]
ALLRVRIPPDRGQGGHPGVAARLRDDPPGRPPHRRGDRRPHGDQVPGPHGRPHEGRRRQVRRHARRGRGPRPRHPRARDQRPHAARRARRLPGPGQAGVLRRRGVGRHPQAAGDALLRHGRHRHRGGRRDPPRPRRPRPLLEHPPAVGLPRQAGHRRDRRHRQGPPARHADPLPAGQAVRRERHDAGGDQPARRARGRHVRRRRRAHGHGERGAPAPEGAPGRARRRRRGDPPGARGDRVRARRRGGRRHGPPRRGRQRHRVQRQPRPRHRRGRRLAHAVRRGPRPRRQPRQLLRDRRQPVRPQGGGPRQARPPEARRRQDRRDDVHRLQHPRRHRRPRRDQGVHRARDGPGGEDRDLPHPGRLGGGGLQDPREVRRRVRRPVGVHARGGAARRREDRSGSL